MGSEKLFLFLIAFLKCLQIKNTYSKIWSFLCKFSEVTSNNVKKTKTYIFQKESICKDRLGAFFHFSRQKNKVPYFIFFHSLPHFFTTFESHICLKEFFWLKNELKTVGIKICFLFSVAQNTNKNWKTQWFAVFRLLKKPSHLPEWLFSFINFKVKNFVNSQNHQTIHFHSEHPDCKAFFVLRRSSWADRTDSIQYLQVPRVCSGNYLK